MKRIVLLLVLSVVLVLPTTAEAYSIFTKVEIVKESAYTIEEVEQIKQLLPQRRDWNSYIIAIKQGMTAAYKVEDFWIEQQDVPIRSAYVVKPNNAGTVQLTKDGPRIFAYGPNNPKAPQEFYTSIADLASQWPYGTYELHVTFTDNHEQTWTITIPNYNTTPFPDIPSGTLTAQANGQLMLNWNTVAGADKYAVECVELKKMQDIFSSSDLHYSHPDSITTPITGAYAGKGDYVIDVDVSNGDFPVEFRSTRGWFSFKKPLRPKVNNIDKCTVTAGQADMDSISLSGTLDAIEADLLIALADGNDIVVCITNENIPFPISKPPVAWFRFDWVFPVNSVASKKGLYNYARTENASQQFFKLDTNNGKMVFSASKTRLTGMNCPFEIIITIGDYEATVGLNETVVNGPKKPCPLPLLQGISNTLDVTKSKFKKGTKSGTDSLTVSGTFTVTGDYKKAPLVITVGNQTFTVPVEQMGDNSIAKIASCKPVSKVGPQVTAKLDYNKCTFTISIKNANITQSGDVAFGIDCFGINLHSPDTIDLN